MFLIAINICLFNIKTHSARSIEMCLFDSERKNFDLISINYKNKPHFISKFPSSRTYISVCWHYHSQQIVSAILDFLDTHSFQLRTKNYPYQFTKHKNSFSNQHNFYDRVWRCFSIWKFYFRLRLLIHLVTYLAGAIKILKAPFDRDNAIKDDSSIE